MLPDFFDPRIQTLLTNGGEPIQSQSHCAQFRGNPPDDFQNSGVLVIEVSPVDDAFVMEDAVSQVADFFPSGIEFFHVTLLTWRVSEGLACECVPEACLGVRFVEEAGPEPEVKFGYHRSGCYDFATNDEVGAGVRQMDLLPTGEVGDDVLPLLAIAARSEAAVQGVAQADFSYLQRRIEGSTKGHVPKIASQSDDLGDAILSVRIEALDGQDGLHLLKKGRVHACTGEESGLMFPR